MQSGTHQIISEFIKSTHKKLRHEASLLGSEQAWKNHCENEEHLKKYAEAMQNLAINYWDKNSEDVSRICWVHSAVLNYIKQIDRYRDREKKILQSFELEESEFDIRQWDNFKKLKLLDVGSCYNPFKKFDLFNVLPLDIAPANEEVLKCDFLNLKVSDRSTIRDNEVLELKKESFHIVVFSLLLEYLPSPDLRLNCCLKAYNLLQFEGILIIITPDSNHIGSNARIMKSWRFVLSKLGFNRVHYEKLTHLHCMVFRKTLFKEIAIRWAHINENRGLYDKIYIPQDFNTADIANVVNSQQNYNKWHQDTFLSDIKIV